jgi:hypothetical protein
MGNEDGGVCRNVDVGRSKDANARAKRESSVIDAMRYLAMAAVSS